MEKRDLALGVLCILGGAVVSVFSGSGTLAIMGAIGLGILEAGATLSANSFAKLR